MMVWSCGLAALLMSGCGNPGGAGAGTDLDFFERQNAAHDGGYIATYPLSDPDACIARLKEEVPPELQPWGCLSIWYHMSRDSPAVNFRLLDLYEQNYPHDTVFAFCQMMRAEFYVDLAKFDSAKICLEDAYQRYMALGRPLDASDAQYLLARSYLYQNRFPEALDTYFGLLSYLNEQSPVFSDRHANLYHDISVAYERSNNREQYKEWLEKCWQTDTGSLSAPWLFRARVARQFSVYFLKHDPDSSIYWARKMQEIYREANPGKPVPVSMQYKLGRAYFESGRCREALPLFLQAYRANPYGGNRMVYYQVPMALGECYLCLGQLDSAEWYVRESLASPDTGNLSVAHGMLQEIYEQKGLYQEALSEALKSRQLFEAKFTADKAEAIAHLDARFKTAQKEHRITELEQERQALNLKMLIGGLALSLALVVLASLYFRQRNRHLILQQQNQLLAKDKALVLAREQLHVQALELSKTALQATQKELDEKARLLELKSQLIQELHMELSQVSASARKPSDPGSGPSALKNMKILTEEDWSVFKKRYDEHFPGFMDYLKIKFPDLTSGETRLILLLKLDFSNKEIAGTLGISPQSVWRNRHRLSKKLGLETTGELNDFIGEQMKR
jgi:tetratricopeptide (TPR) repeat protein